jgi:hypothetical protein
MSIMKFVEWTLWGFFMSIGWAVGQNMLNFIGQFVHAH